MKHPFTKLVGAAWLVGLCLAFVHLDPTETWPLARMLQAGAGVVFAGAWILGVEAVGDRLRRAFDRSADASFLENLVWGMALWGLIGLVLGALGLLGRPAAAVCLVLALAARVGRPLPKPHITPHLSPLREDTYLSPSLILPMAIVLTVGLIGIAAPAVGTDEQYYHLALPRLLTESGGLIGGPLLPEGSRPLALHLPYTLLYATGGELTVRAFHLFLAAALVLTTGRIAERLAGPLAGLVSAGLLVASGSFLSEVGQVGNDLPSALCVLVALQAALANRWRTLAVAAGTALAIKYTAWGPLLGVFLVAHVPVRHRLLAAGGAMALVAPWWIRNLVEGHHALFPFAGWPTDLPIGHLEKYGAGRSALDFLLLPYNAVFTADPASFRFLGRIHPLFAALFPFAIWTAWRRSPVARWVVCGTVGALAWATGPHWLRYLLSTLPLLAIACGVGAAEFRDRTSPAWSVVLFIAFLVGLPANLGPTLIQVSERLPVIVGEETRTEFLERMDPVWPAVTWCNNHLPPDARVALLFSWNRYGLERQVVLGSVEDHVPSRVWLRQHGAQSLTALRAVGVTHVLVERARFIQKVYPFLTPEVLATDFNEPVALLDDLLLNEAQLLFQESRVRIYALGTTETRLTPP